MCVSGINYKQQLFWRTLLTHACEDSFLAKKDTSCITVQAVAKRDLRCVNTLTINYMCLQDVYTEVFRPWSKSGGSCRGASQPEGGRQAAPTHQGCPLALLGQVDRKLVKQTVMTSVYGVTYIGARRLSTEYGFFFLFFFLFLFLELFGSYSILVISGIVLTTSLSSLSSHQHHFDTACRPGTRAHVALAMHHCFCRGLAFAASFINVTLTNMQIQQGNPADQNRWGSAPRTLTRSVRVHEHHSR
jgi:hypothetical protein